MHNIRFTGIIGYDDGSDLHITYEFLDEEGENTISALQLIHLYHLLKGVEDFDDLERKYLAQNRRNLSPVDIKGVEVNVDFYNDFVKRNIRVNEHTPNDQIAVFYVDGTTQIFRIK